MNTSTATSLQVRRLKYAVQLRRDRVDEGNGERPYVGLEDIESGTGRLVPTFGEDSSDHAASTSGGDSLCNTFEPADVLFGKLRPYLAKAWVAEFSGRCTTELLVMLPARFEPRFLRYVCLSPDFVDAVNASTFGSKMPRADWDFIGNMSVPVPEIAKQRAIADYLDRETERIDQLIAAKEWLLALLAEKRRALITYGVTRGLDPTASLRDSGAEWLGSIPQHWVTERARWLFTERDERSVGGDEELLTVSHITGVTPRSEKVVTMFEAESLEGYKLCFPGDLVINTLWAWMGAMGITNHTGIVSPAYHVYVPSSRLNPAYVEALCRTNALAEETQRHSKGVWSSRLRLYPESFFEIMFPVPPLPEQHAIVEELGRASARTTAMHAALEESLALLRERRGAIINAAVLGHIGTENVT